MQACALQWPARVGRQNSDQSMPLAVQTMIGGSPAACDQSWEAQVITATIPWLPRSSGLASATVLRHATSILQKRSFAGFSNHKFARSSGPAHTTNLFQCHAACFHAKQLRTLSIIAAAFRTSASRCRPTCEIRYPQPGCPWRGGPCQPYFRKMWRNYAK